MTGKETSRYFKMVANAVGRDKSLPLGRVGGCQAGAHSVVRMCSILLLSRENFCLYFWGLAFLIMVSLEDWFIPFSSLSKSKWLVDPKRFMLLIAKWSSQYQNPPKPALSCFWGTSKKSSPPCWRQFWRERKRLKIKGEERKMQGLELEKGSVASSPAFGWCWSAWAPSDLHGLCGHSTESGSCEHPEVEGTQEKLQQASRALPGPFANSGHDGNGCPHRQEKTKRASSLGKENLQRLMENQEHKLIHSSWKPVLHILLNRELCP